MAAIFVMAIIFIVTSPLIYILLIIAKSRFRERKYKKQRGS